MTERMLYLIERSAVVAEKSCKVVTDIVKAKIGNASTFTGFLNDIETALLEYALPFSSVKTEGLITLRSLKIL